MSDFVLDTYIGRSGTYTGTAKNKKTGVLHRCNIGRINKLDALKDAAELATRLEGNHDR